MSNGVEQLSATSNQCVGGPLDQVILAALSMLLKSLLMGLVTQMEDITSRIKTALL